MSSVSPIKMYGNLWHDIYMVLLELLELLEGALLERSR
jgi:hypothetical protein